MDLTKKIVNILAFVFIFLFNIFFIISILDFSILEKSVNTVSDFNVSNIGGYFGSSIVNIMFSLFGFWTLFLIGFVSNFIKNVIQKKDLQVFKIKILYFIILLIPSVLSLFYISKTFSVSFPFNVGMGGILGVSIFELLDLFFITNNLSPLFHIVIFLFSTAFSILLFTRIFDFQFSVNGVVILMKKMQSLIKQKKIVIKKNIPSQQHIPVPPKLKEIKREVKPQIQSQIQIKKQDYILPTVDLLKNIKLESVSELNNQSNKYKARMLEEALKEYGLDGKITDIKTGPVITLFEMMPGVGIKITDVKRLHQDIARKLQTISVRISVIPNTDKIGLELANNKRQMVSIRSQFESKNFTETEYILPISLGASTNGTPIFVDLATMPHLLIAGTTGSGKSVGVNGMILSLLYKYRPDECKFIMIDPKMVEFANYEDVPHLIFPIVTEPGKAIAALKWVAAEMDERYLNMQSIGVKDIKSFNEKLKNLKSTTIKRKIDVGIDTDTGEILREDKEIKLTKMPYIVVVVDELADLMQMAKKEVEGTIARLAAKARAAGIHLIFSTQRPSVDVLTGTIKSNFPIRLSYKVASGQDSRTILDEYGAELMLGKGDGLYRAMNGQIIRIHGAFVSDSEVEAVVNFIKPQAKPNYIELKPLPTTNIANNAMMTVDKLAMKQVKNEELYDKALEIVLTTKKTSISFLQRQLGIGYNKSANIIEKMEKEGILSAPDSSGKRNLLR